MNQTPIFKDLVLVGGGHTHALVLRKWAMNPLPGVRITLVSPQTMTPYSGMLPGLIAGHYSFEQTHIDLVKLSRWANIRFIQDSVTAIDVASNTLALKNRPDIEFDAVSIDIGSTPNQQIAGSAEFTTPVKPISEFYQRWNSIQQQVQQGKIQSLSVVGGGAGSVEVIMAIAFKLRQFNQSIQYHLITAADDVLPGYNRTVRNRVKQQLKEYKISIHSSTRVARLERGVIHCQNSDLIQADEIIWCTQASGSTWLQESQLACDDAGFMKVRQTLQSLAYDHIFAAGDIANMVANPRPKAGVYAVRQADTLFHNLRAQLLKQKLLEYKPQDGFLSLLALGEKRATGSKSLLSFSGDWVWRWKDSIDTKFMNQFHQLPELSMTAITAVNPALIAAAEKAEQHDPLKRCTGCGAKVGADVLQQVLNEVLGEAYYQPQDAVQISPDAKLIYQTVDALKTVVDDPWVFGKIAVNHALSDLYAMNLKPESAQVLITLPYASQSIQKRQLKALMQGLTRQLDNLQCRFLGGHTSEANELSVGLVVNGIEQEQPLFHKQGLVSGDKLVLSKPLGTGVILAGAMQNQCDGLVFNQAIASMLQANNQAAKILSQLNVKACTDVSGFGLLGHLQELCLASACAARLNLNAIPVLSGAEALALKGIHSSLYTQNRSAIDWQGWPDSITQQPRFNLLFDPQTSGGLLAGIPAEDYKNLDDSFHQQFYTIGDVTAQDDCEAQIQIEAV
ncbi:selenide, water dikinase SelD [Methyloprofundus sp.]|uniref:selenide, water dikinase SelD n=1 Tax=Methyloprofundus sp. TaxID=2020875 RepID=UPI003D0E510E